MKVCQSEPRTRIIALPAKELRCERIYTRVFGRPTMFLYRCRCTNISWIGSLRCDACKLKHNMSVTHIPYIYTVRTDIYVVYARARGTYVSLYCVHVQFPLYVYCSYIYHIFSYMHILYMLIYVVHCIISYHTARTHALTMMPILASTRMPSNGRSKASRVRCGVCRAACMTSRPRPVSYITH